MLIVDGHLDLGWIALQWNRDLTRSVAELRREPYVAVPFESDQPARTDIVPTLSLPSMRAGRVGLCFSTLLARSTGHPIAHIDYRAPAQANAIALGQLAYYRALERQGWLRPIRDRATLDAHVTEWEQTADPAASQKPPIGFILAMEGADPILEPDDLPEWHALGLRAIGLSHFGAGRYAGGTASAQGLTDRGRALLAQMRRHGVILDASHLSDPAFREVFERWDGPTMASHTNCRALVEHQRQFTDEQIRELIRHDAVIGAVFDAWMLVPGWRRGAADNPRFTMERIADHVDHVCQLAGSARHCAIGSDIDGGFGKEQEPADLDTIADVAKLEAILRRRGHTDADLAGIFHGNWLRLVRAAWR